METGELYKKLITNKFQTNSYGKVKMELEFKKYLEEKTKWQRNKIWINFYFEHGIKNLLFFEVLLTLCIVIELLASLEGVGNLLEDEHLRFWIKIGIIGFVEVLFLIL